MNPLVNMGEIGEPLVRGGLVSGCPDVVRYPPADELYQRTVEQMLRMANQVRSTDWIIDMATTGAAGFLRFALWAEPGASDNLMGERWTYAEQHTDDLIGRKPPHGKYSREASAMAMTAAAYTSAKRLAFERDLHGAPTMGVAMAAVVTTGRVRRGEDACSIAVRTDAGFHVVRLVMDKASARGQEHEQRRLEEGIVCDLVTLMTMLSVMGLEVPSLDPKWGVAGGDFESAPDGTLILRPRHVIDTPLSALESPFYHVLMPDQTVVPLADVASDDFVLLPGSFNPFHHGHEQIASMAKEQTGRDVLFQMTAHHPAKGVIPTDELLRRVNQLQFRWPVVLFDTEGLYAEKAVRVPGMTMLIGVDVVYGLQDLRYYGGDRTRRREMFQTLVDHGTRFLVAGRAVEGVYETLGDVPVPGNVAHLFAPLGGRVDVSSTQLRNQ